MYDLIIIGAGCAGASGAMYAARMNLKTLMIGELPGGLITTTHIVENWPGIKSISGPDLGISLVDHATSFGVPLANEKVTASRKRSKIHLRESKAATSSKPVLTAIMEKPSSSLPARDGKNWAFFQEILTGKQLRSCTELTWELTRITRTLSSSAPELHWLMDGAVQ